VLTQGVETELELRPIRGLTISGSYSYIDASYRSFPGVACYVTATGALQPGCDVNKTIDASGNQLIDAPKNLGEATVMYTHGVTQNLRGFVSTSVYARSEYNYSANGDPRTVQPGYGIFDASFGVSSSDERWKVSVYGRNLGNKQFTTNIVTSAASNIARVQTFNLNAFRTVGIMLDARF
jgi:iron complex outermembrane receptor protein